MKNIVKQKTCFKNLDRPTCIDLILTKSSRSFQDTCTVETGLTDFHKLVVTVLELYFPKQKPYIKTFWDYKRFQNDLLRSEFDYKLSKRDVCKLEFEHLLSIFIESLNNHAPVKKKSRWRNTYLKEKTAESKIAHDKQRNYCVNLFLRTKKNYFSNISICFITDNKTFSGNKNC